MRKVLADWTQVVPESEIRRLLKSKTKYYLAGGLPGNLPTKIFPEILRELAEYYDSDEQNVINEFQYGPTAGFPSLRKVLAERIHKRDKIDYISGAEDWEKILITTGSQQAIYISLDYYWCCSFCYNRRRYCSNSFTSVFRFRNCSS